MYVECMAYPSRAKCWHYFSRKKDPPLGGRAGVLEAFSICAVFSLVADALHGDCLEFCTVDSNVDLAVTESTSKSCMLRALPRLTLEGSDNGFIISFGPDCPNTSRTKNDAKTWNQIFNPVSTDVKNMCCIPGTVFPFPLRLEISLPWLLG